MSQADVNRCESGCYAMTVACAQLSPLSLFAGCDSGESRNQANVTV